MTDLGAAFTDALPDWRIERQPLSGLTLFTSPNGVTTRISLRFLQQVGTTAEHVTAITGALKLAAIEQHGCEVTIELTIERLPRHELPWLPAQDPYNPLARAHQGEIVTATYRVE